MGELLALLALGAVAGFCALAFSVALLSLKFLFGLLLLPVRLLAWLVVLPLVLLKSVLGLLAGVVLLPLLVIAGLGGMFVLFALPLVPVVLIGVAVWAVIGLSRRAPGTRSPAALPGA
jgi:hypothetical protein